MTKKLPSDHTEDENAIDLPEEVNNPASLELTQEPDAAELLIARTKLIRRVEKFAPVESVQEVEKMEDARTLRLQLVKSRTAIDKFFKEKGDVYRKRVDAINAIRRPLENESKDAEAFLKEQEEFAIRAEQLRISELRQERAKLLAPYANPDLFKLGDMTEVEWKALFSGQKAAFEAAEAARIAEEKRVKEEQERVARENEELRQRNAQLQKESEARAAAQAAEKRKADEALRLEREKADKERRELEATQAAELAKIKAANAAKEKAQADALAAERKKLADIEAANKLKEAAERKRLAEEAAAAKAAARAPDKVKLLKIRDQAASLAFEIRGLRMASPEAQDCWVEILAASEKLTQFIEKKAESLA